MNVSLEGKVGLVTGAAVGIGRSVALEMAAAGAIVMVSDLDERGGEETVREILDSGGTAAFTRCDVSVAEECAELVAATVGAFGALNLAVNNAGVGGAAATTGEYDPAEWRRVVGVNLDGVFHCMHYELPAMLNAGGGVIVNVASVLGLVGWPQASAYVAAKHGVMGLTKSAALEYASRNVRIAAVNPGFIEGGHLAEAGITSGSEMHAFLTGKHAMKRLGTHVEVAKAVVWLLSDEASFVTGASLSVDGGYTAS